ncbi:relaxase/mobilization nuclease domain-containing protein [Clostridium sp. C1]|uniref:relaxase/mobilization nuclease domain-containing protein n=1 Tax=Clostridium sp. C1 TaxID=1155388 RepID=UPI001BA8189A|nr:relaxase/mobilization nuclease domain-containing protein [Clostridium sp. C1]QUN13818.1 relaxase/mobilization nuclease domain-containing protein [Clostridium sp. C1]
MATTGIWKIEKRLDNVLDYTTNVEKTKHNENNNYYDLHNVIEYVESDYKTEEQLFVSGINCSPKTALEEMSITKEQYGKTDGILGFHAFQSFAEGEVTPEQCHAIGVRLAEEMWGDRFEVVVSTHINTNHYHNHFVINSVSFKDGKRYYDKRETYAELRRLSDSLCEEYGLSVIQEKPCRNSKINFANYQKDLNNKVNYYSIAKEDLDRAIGMATSYYDFEDLMKAMDYELIYRANKLSIKRSPYKKNIRIERYFGSEYSIERITQRIEEHIKKVPFVEEYGINKKINANYYKKRKPKGFYALYIHYCYLLKVFPKKYPYQKLSPAIRADVRKMEDISNETKLLVRNNLKTDEQFFLFKEEKEKQLNDLMDQRSKLWYKHKKSKSKQEKDEIREQINELNKEITPLRKEVVLCKDILERSKKIEKNLQELSDENIKVKEVEKNEHIR